MNPKSPNHKFIFCNVAGIFVDFIPGASLLFTGNMKLALLFVFIGLAVVFNHFSIGYGLPTPDFGTDLQRAVEDAARGAQRAAEDGYNTVRDTLNGDS
jgi:hypothetical protein